MSREQTLPSILELIEPDIVKEIAHSQGVSLMEALRMFAGSQTHEMLVDNDLRMWHFSPLALFDMWENELATGDPRNSLYLRGDEIG